MRWFVAIMLVMGVPSMAADCPTMGEIDEVIRAGTVLVLGELHGTAESPAFVLDLACHATAADLPVVVGLELPTRERERIDAFLASAGTARDREALIAGPVWQSADQDGRTSFAMLELIDGLRRLRATGKSIRVVPFDTGNADGDQARDRGMGRAVAAVAKATPRAMTVVLTGNLHSRFAPGRASNAAYEPMAYVMAQQIPERNVITLDVEYGEGSAWVCAPDCGPIEVHGNDSGWRWTIEIDEATDSAGHHGRYFVGSVTASPPARGGVATVAVDLFADEPPKATGELTAGEKLFQGNWQSYIFASDARSYEIRIVDRDFRAEKSTEEWYAGYVSIRPDTSPPQIDFTIEDCDCNYIGSTSRGIYYEDEGAIVIAAPPPGDPRPKAFEREGEMLRLRPLAPAEADDGKKPE